MKALLLALALVSSFATLSVAQADWRDNNGGWGNNGGHGRRDDGFHWKFKHVDRNGCNGCELRASEYATRGCTDLSYYERDCNFRNAGIRLACEQPGTKNNDNVYICTNY